MSAVRIVLGVFVASILLALVMPDVFRSPQRQLKPAILDGDIRKVQHLLETHTLDINWRGDDGTAVTPLSVAASHGQLEIARLLLQRGADPDLASAENETPLRFAAYHGDLAMCQLLIDAGADLNKADNRHGWTPLRMASYKGHHQVAQYLKSHGALE